MRGNTKSAKSDFNAAELEKLMERELEHTWAMHLKIDLVRHIKDAGYVPMGVAKEF